MAVAWRSRASLLALAGTACAGAPSYLRPRGEAGRHEAALGWLLLAVGAGVCVAVIVLVLTAAFRKRGAGNAGADEGRRARRWIHVSGIAIPALMLVGIFIVTLATLRILPSDAGRGVLTIQVTGRQWWWEVRYPSGPGDRGVTANEIHVPSGERVRIELMAGDVIHSFWVPELAGKTDLIPGQRNVTWIEADSAGTFWGGCAEYCGLQHAHMSLRVIAEPRPDFDRWLAAERADAVPPTDSLAVAGRRVFETAACAACHAIRGTPAAGLAGPDLTHVAGRATLAAGTLANNRGNLAGWIGNPQGLKPGSAMPAVPLSPRELLAVVSYLQTLR